MKRARLAPLASLPALDDYVPPWLGEAVDLDGSVLYVRRTPAMVAGAEPALYVHGLGGSSLNWTDLAYLMAGRLDGEAIDLPGFGNSDPAPRYTVPAVAQRVARWIEASGRGPVHLVGNSFGGAVAVRVAGTRPDLVRTLTLVSPAMPFMDPRRSEHGRIVPLLLLPGVERLAAKRLAAITPETLTREVIRACFADPDRISQQRLEEAIVEVQRRFEAPWYIRAYLRTLRGLVGSFVRAYLPGSNSLWRIAARIQAPTLVLTGRQDRIIDIRVSPAVAKIIPNSRLLMLEGVGHVAQMETPLVVAQAMTALLDEVAAERSRVVEVQARTGGLAPRLAIMPESATGGMAT
jgi:pimeloyl-ACP methyl ester carboxylesterase